MFNDWDITNIFKMELFKSNFRFTFIRDGACSFPICQLNGENSKAWKESRTTRWRKLGFYSDRVQDHL